jgi:hypothetical protein
MPSDAEFRCNREKYTLHVTFHEAEAQCDRETQFNGVNTLILFYALLCALRIDIE